MNKFFAFFILVMGLSLPLSSHAGILVEPFLGYEFGQLQLESTGGNDVGGDVQGLNLGVRVGYKFWLPWVALEYGMNLAEGKLKYNSDVTPDADTERKSLGIVGGADLPLGFRAWGGYIFDTELNMKGNFGNRKLSGNAFKIGGGFSVIPLVSLNLEYIINKFNKIEGSAVAGSSDPDTFYRSYDFNTILLSVSAPFNF